MSWHSQCSKENRQCRRLARRATKVFSKEESQPELSIVSLNCATYTTNYKPSLYSVVSLPTQLVYQVFGPNVSPSPTVLRIALYKASCIPISANLKNNLQSRRREVLPSSHKVQHSPTNSVMKHWDM